MAQFANIDAIGSGVFLAIALIAATFIHISKGSRKTNRPIEDDREWFK